MPYICYKDRSFSPRSEAMIKVANAIIKEYQGQGFDLTLRQLYYQFVSRDILPNNMKSYKNLGSVVNDARLAGRIDWNAIVDRTRELVGQQHWDSPGELLKAASNSYHIDRWAGQPVRPEVWIEKDALAGVFERVCKQWDVDYFSCRGYTSQSEMWEAGQRIEKRYTKHNQETLILHFGDHDPSGIDMSRDIRSRLELFLSGENGELSDYANDCFKFQRVALHMSQVKEAKLPPNPAKLSDSRAQDYIDQFGNESWELDALDPRVLAKLVEINVQRCIVDEKLWKKAEKEEVAGRKKILAAAKKI